jgi:hypothetical protein
VVGFRHQAACFGAVAGLNGRRNPAFWKASDTDDDDDGAFHGGLKHGKFLKRRVSDDIRSRPAVEALDARS